MRIGFTCGSYDLLHAGHVMALKESADRCDWLIVGLQSDPTIDRPEKNKPIQSLEERRIQLLGCRYVDEVAVYHTEKDLFRYLFDNRARIDVRFLGMDWQGKEFTGYDMGMNCEYTTRDHNYSSSELRRRIYAAEHTEHGETWYDRPA